MPGDSRERDADTVFAEDGSSVDDEFEFSDVDGSSLDVRASIESDAAAIFDVLLIVRMLGVHNPPGRMDVHTFAYLGCLMSVFAGEPASSWGYSFSAVPPTLPFSPVLERAIDSASRSGWLSSLRAPDMGGREEFVLSAVGATEADFLSQLGSLATRSPFVEAAATAATFSSTAAVVNSMASESQLAKASQLGLTRALLTEASAGTLYREFDALAHALQGSDYPLAVPASLYVDYLQAQMRNMSERAEEDSIA